MAKIYKTEMYILDVNDDFEDIDDFLNYIEMVNKYTSILAFNKSTSNTFEWFDEIDLNQKKCSLESFEKYFK